MLPAFCWLVILLSIIPILRQDENSVCITVEKVAERIRLSLLCHLFYQIGTPKPATYGILPEELAL